MKNFVCFAEKRSSCKFFWGKAEFGPKLIGLWSQHHNITSGPPIFTITTHRTQLPWWRVWRKTTHTITSGKSGKNAQYETKPVRVWTEIYTTLPVWVWTEACPCKACTGLNGNSYIQGLCGFELKPIQTQKNPGVWLENCLIPPLDPPHPPTGQVWVMNGDDGWGDGNVMWCWCDGNRLVMTMGNVERMWCDGWCYWWVMATTISEWVTTTKHHHHPSHDIISLLNITHQPSLPSSRIYTHSPSLIITLTAPLWKNMVVLRLVSNFKWNVWVLFMLHFKPVHMWICMGLSSNPCTCFIRKETPCTDIKTKPSISAKSDGRPENTGRKHRVFVQILHFSCLHFKPCHISSRNACV